MARASEKDLDTALALCGALEAFSKGFMPMDCGGEDDAFFDLSKADDCQKAMEHLLEIERRGSLFRVVFGMATVLDPCNGIVDQETNRLERHPSLRRMLPDVTEPLPTIKGASTSGGYVIVTPGGWGDKAAAVKAAILSHFPVNPEFTPRLEVEP